VYCVSDEKLKATLEALIAEAGIDVSATAHVVAARDTRLVLPHLFLAGRTLRVPACANVAQL